MADISIVPPGTIDLETEIVSEAPLEITSADYAGALAYSYSAAHDISRPDLVKYDEVTGDASEVATLVVGGMKFEDWETVWIQWNWNDWFSRFRFTCAEREPYPESAAVLQFKPGDACEIYLGGILVIQGLIVTRQVAYDDKSHGVMLEGFSASWYAQRSSIDHKTKDFNGKNIVQIAKEVLAPTGVGLQLIGEIDMRKFESGATPEGGETIGQFLERLARNRKIIVSNTPTGDFLFIGEHAWSPVGDLIEGENIKKMQCVITNQGTYSEFITLAQKMATDKSNMREAAEQEARAKGLLPRYSVLITTIEHPVAEPAEVAKRNDTEVMWNEDTTIINANVTVYGWFRPRPSTVPSLALMSPGGLNHVLWQAGDEVRVNSPMAMLNGYPLKIRTVTWTQDNQGGTQTLLQLTTPRGLNSKTPVPRESVREPSKPNTDAPQTPPIFSPAP